MKKLIIFSIAVCTLVLSCKVKNFEANYDIIPAPKSVVYTNSEVFFLLDKDVKIAYPARDNNLKLSAKFLQTYIYELTGQEPEVIAIYDKDIRNKCITIRKKNAREIDDYSIDITENYIIIEGSSDAIIFNAIQSIRKSIATSFTNREEYSQKKNVLFPTAIICDQPRFQYRGMHLDVARHFRTTDEVKRYIDILALHNVNHLHWHLSDDQGWRIEIKKYPRLTTVGSKRSGTIKNRNVEEYDNIPYGGFYTREQIEDVIDYAAKHHITIVPEIDLPGHMLAALAAYPHLGCTGGPYEVGGRWGVEDDVLCAGNDSVYTFIKDVLTEIIELFPSPYIHIGGDECPKVRWEECPKCRQKILEKGFESDEHHSAEEYLQSYIISYAKDIVEEKGRRIIGWDEILEGGIPENAVVMSWRGTDGGIKAAQTGHQVIMTPNSHLYFDYYQSLDTDKEPAANGHFIPIERVYDFEPVPDILTEEQGKLILGVQANMWSESMKTFDVVEYMLLPRLAALSEVQWSDPSSKDYNNFLERLKLFIHIYNMEGYNYAKHIFDVKAEVTPITGDNHKIEFSLSTLDDATILYTLDGDTPKINDPTSITYKGPFHIDKNCTVKAVAYRNGEYSRIFEEKVYFSKSTGRDISLAHIPHRNYTYNGASTLVDGLRGGSNYKTGKWLGFYNGDFDAVIDLGSADNISNIEIGLNIKKGDWVFDTRSIVISVSEDDEEYLPVYSESFPQMSANDPDGIKRYKVELPSGTIARYVEIFLETEKIIPDWHAGAGSPGFVFVDEIEVN